MVIWRGTYYVIKDHPHSKRGNPLPPDRLHFPITSKVFFYMHHPTDRIAHTTVFVIPVRYVGSIRRPIPPWANALTTELHLAPHWRGSTSHWPRLGGTPLLDGRQIHYWPLHVLAASAIFDYEASLANQKSLGDELCMTKQRQLQSVRFPSPPPPPPPPPPSFTTDSLFRMF